MQNFHDVQADIQADQVCERQRAHGVIHTELHNGINGFRRADATYEMQFGWALYDAGRYQDSRSHLIPALRAARPASTQRSLLRGLLGECYLRTGQPLRAERCVRRALSEGCEQDSDRYIEAGHRFMLGRINRFRGHLSHAMETLHEALAANPTGKLRVPILNEIAKKQPR